MTHSYKSGKSDELEVDILRRRKLPCYMLSKLSILLLRFVSHTVGDAKDCI